MKTRIFLLFACVLYCQAAFATTCDTEYWQYLYWKNWECGPYKLYTTNETRLNRHISKFYYNKITENFAFQALPNLGFEVHYSFVSSKPRGATHFSHRHRLELEINPSFRLCNGITLYSRNRLESTKEQHSWKIEYELRHRLQAVFPLKNKSKLVSITCSDEVFYSFESYKFSENRFIPIEFNYQFTPKVTLDVFVMVRNFYSNAKWYRSIVLGSELGF